MDEVDAELVRCWSRRSSSVAGQLEEEIGDCDCMEERWRCVGVDRCHFHHPVCKFIPVVRRQKRETSQDTVPRHYCPARYSTTLLLSLPVNDVKDGQEWSGVERVQQEPVR